MSIKPKIILFILLMTFFYKISGQNIIKLGCYKSKEGSQLILKSDSSFSYQKERNRQFDISTKEIFMKSYGKFTVTENVIFLTTKNNGLSSEELLKKIKLSEMNYTKQKKDSVLISVINKKNNLKVYICNTGLEHLNVPGDVSSCLELKSRNVLPAFYPEKYFFRLYPDFDNFRVRYGYHINTMYFDSAEFSKKDNSDLVLDLDFNISDFALTRFEQDIVLIKKDKLFFKGEEFILESKN